MPSRYRSPSSVSSTKLGPGPVGEFPFPEADRSSQVHLVTDSTGARFLLAYRASTDDDETGDDFVDVHPVSLSPFAIQPAIASVHVFLRPGWTSFAKHRHAPRQRPRPAADQLLVPLGRGRRWPFGFVSRVDELPS